jgi:hypothetical protein
MRRTILLSLAVCALAIGVRVPLLLRIPPAAWAGMENERVAVALMRGDGWADPYAAGTTGPTAHVAPLYPLLLAGLYRLCGTYETATGRLAQQCFSLAVAICVLLLLPALARKLRLSVAAGWAAAFVGAWLRANQWNEVTGHFEQGLAALLVLGLIWGCASLQQEAWLPRRAILATGVLLGLTALLCPNLLLAPGLFFVVELVRRSGDRIRILRCCLILAVVCLAFVAPWAARNYLVLGGFVPLRSNFGLELAVGNRSGADGHTYAPGFTEMHPFSCAAEREHLVRIGELAYMREKQQQALTWIAENPSRFAWLTIRRAGLFWFTPDERWCSLEPRLWLSSRVYGILGFGMFLELVRLLWRRRPTGVLLSCIVLGIGIPYFVTHVEMRYRLPLVGLSALASCDLAAAIVHRVRGKLRWSTPSPPDSVVPPSLAA